MNKLVVTLVIVAIAAIVSAQWGITRLFNQTQLSATEATQSQAFIQQLGQSLATALGASENPGDILQQVQQPGLEFSLATVDALELPQVLEQTLHEQHYLTLQSEQDNTYIYPLGKSRQVLLINRQVSIPPDNTQLKLLLTILFYTCIAGVLFIWSRPLIKRLIALRHTTRAFGEGNLQQRIDTGSSLYISDIEKEFNRMADRIETLIADNKLLSSAVSHDLKTPLARLRFGIDVLQDTEDEQLREKYLAKISRDLQEMEALVDTLLCYARLDQAKLELHRDNIDLVEFIDELTATLDSGTVKIHWHAPNHACPVIGDKRYLSLLINNLIANACQHAKHAIAIQLDQVGSTVKLLVEDDGPGIPLAQRQAVLKPFVRGEQARTTPGHGMGLAIVNRIVQWHRWGLTLGDSSSLGGAQVEVTIH